MIVDGRALAKEVLRSAKERAALLQKEPHIAVVVTSETPATQSYLSIKEKRAIDAGCVMDIVRLPENVSTEVFRTMMQSLVVDTILVQLPLSTRVDTKEVCDAIPVEKDADVLSTTARMKFEVGEYDALIPPVASAVAKILEFGNVDPKGKKAVVIGAGWLVGAPVATWLRQQGAEVEVVTLESGDLTAALRTADIIVSGAGSPHFIKPEMLKEAKTAGGSSPDGSSDEPFRGVVLIDAGTTELGGVLAGDADPACASACSLFTPVPGGVGPLAVACLFENVVTLAERAINT